MAAHAHITRRSALADLVAVGAISTATGAAAAPVLMRSHPDADLIRLGAELSAAWKVEDATRHEFIGRSTHDTDEIVEKAAEACHDIIDRIRALRATTLDGFVVKARAVSWCYAGESVTYDGEAAATSEHLMAGIVNDILHLQTA